MSRIKVMIIDDDFYVREALEMLLRRNPKTTVSSIASTPDEAIEILEECKDSKCPDIALLDVKFENSATTGIELIKEIKKIKPKVKVLMSSMTNDEDMIIEAISQGADGYVWKNESADGIVSAIQKVVEGRFVLTKSIAGKIIGKTNELKEYYFEIMPDKKEYQNLTDKLEKTLYLYCICGMSAKEIADELCVSIHTVNSRIKNAYQILQTTNKSETFEQLVNRFK